MLKPQKNRLFEKIFCLYNRNLLKRRFHSLKVSGLANLLNKDPNLPMIIFANHSSWWDGLIILEILKKFDFQNFVIMEEKNLKRLFLFRMLGAFSINRENYREAARSIKYAAQLLKENANNTVLIFPQGEVLPNDLRPLQFYSGLVRIVEKTNGVLIVPIALRLEFLGDYKPEIFVKIDEPDIISTNTFTDRKVLNKNFELKLASNLDQIKKDINVGNISNYEKLL